MKKKKKKDGKRLKRKVQNLWEKKFDKLLLEVAKKDKHYWKVGGTI
jgi:hypothetical protein